MDPYAPIRAAVKGYAARPPRHASGPAGSPGPAPARSDREPAVGVYDPIRLKLVATYSAVGYPRWLRRLAVECSQGVPVSIYVGTISPGTRESTYGDGSRADFSPSVSPLVPQGVPVFIVWDVTASTATGSATCTFEQVL